MTTSATQFRGVTSLITVDRRLSKPLYQQIYDAFRLRVLRGELRAGQVVPSTRELARELRVSRLPVLDAYSQLLAEGYFESRVGSGTFIASALRVEKDLGPAESRPLHGTRRISTLAAGVPPYEKAPATLGPFQLGQPDLHSFPIEVWSKLVARYSRNIRVKGLQYGDPMGLPELREAIAHYLRTSRAVHCEAAQIMIVSGSQQGLKAAGVVAVPVPVDAEGLNVRDGARRSRKARAVFVTPSHQYPLGVTMSAARRLELLDW